MRRFSIPISWKQPFSRHHEERLREFRYVNFRDGVRGHLPQERFHSFPIQDDQHLLTVVRYVERNPVRARLVRRAEDDPWSSARAHVTGHPDQLVSPSLLQALVSDWRQVLQDGEEQLPVIRQHVRTGRPGGTHDSVQTLEQQLGRTLLHQNGGWPK
jgi:putative transposase